MADNCAFVDDVVPAVSTDKGCVTLPYQAQDEVMHTPVRTVLVSLLDDGGLYMDRQGVPLCPQPHPCEQGESGASPLSRKHSEEEIMAFGGMMEMEVKSSLRLREQHNADLPQLQRAMDLAARKTYGSPPGISPNAKPSLHAFTNSEIKRRAGI